MFSSAVTAALLHGMRPSIGESLDLAVTPVDASLALKGPGLYEVVNLGPDPVYVRMLPAGTSVDASDSDYVLSPIGSGDKCRQEVFVSSTDKTNFQDIDNELHAISDAGKAATLRVTRLSVV